MFRYFSYGSPSTSQVSSPSSSQPSSPISSPVSSLYSSYSISPLAISSSESSIQTPSCAFPSWPRRSSLDGAVEEATSYISDDDLFPDVFDDSEADYTPISSPCRSPQLQPQVPLISRSAVRDLLALKEQQQKKQTRRSSKKSRSNSSKPMSPIQEVGE